MDIPKHSKWNVLWVALNAGSVLSETGERESGSVLLCCLLCVSRQFRN